jgi:hypothetical protein
MVVAEMAEKKRLHKEMVLPEFLVVVVHLKPLLAIELQGNGANGQIIITYDGPGNRVWVHPASPFPN